jgi:hypothetical protein
VEHNLHDLNNQQTTADTILNSTKIAIDIKNRELANLECKKKQLEDFIAGLKRDNTQYVSFRNVEEERMKKMLDDKKRLLHIALTSVLEVLKEDPNKQLLIYDSLDDLIGIVHPIPPGLNRQQYRQFCLRMLLESSAEVFDKLLSASVDSIMSSVVAKSATIL